MAMNRDLRARFPNAQGCLAAVEVDLGNPNRKLKVRICQDLSVASRQAVYAGLTPEQQAEGLSYRIFCGIQGVYTDDALTAMCQAVWLEPELFDGKIKVVNLTALQPHKYKRDGDNIAIVGKEVKPVLDADDSEDEDQESLYPDSLALAASETSAKVVTEHRIHYPNGVGGRASYRPGHSTTARRLNRLSALNEGKTNEEAAKIAAEIAAKSRKRAAAHFGPDARKKNKGGAAAPAAPATQKLLTELTAAIGGPAAVEAYLAGRRAAAADNAAA
eukprot:tig00020734_g13600.t1